MIDTSITMQHIRQLIEDDFNAVNKTIIEQLHSRVNLVENIGQYITEAGGKRLRPMLALLGAKTCGYKGTQHIELATIIEFIHTATLLHDDVVDISSLRRGRPTANTNWGNAPSVLVGDFIYSRAFQMLVRLNSMPIMQLLSDTTNQIAEGEVLQLTKAGDASTSFDDYLQVITDKTAILFAAALKGAAILAEKSELEANALHEYGLALGIAFQIADDMLDYQGDAATMGKNVGDDLSEGKPTLPLIYTIANDEQNKALVVKAIEEKSTESLAQIIEIIHSNGALEHTEKVASEYVEKAKQSLLPISDSAYKEALINLADFALARKQ